MKLFKESCLIDVKFWSVSAEKNYLSPDVTVPWIGKKIERAINKLGTAATILASKEFKHF